MCGNLLCNLNYLFLQVNWGITDGSFILVAHADNSPLLLNT